MTQENFEAIKKQIETSELTPDEITTLRESLGSNRDNMTIEQYEGLMEAVDKASESNRPFAVATNDTLAVAGDANDTKVKKYTYEIKFVKPIEENGEIIGEQTETKTYKNIYITPRKQTRVTKLLTLMMPYFIKQNEDGTTGKYTVYEIVEIISNFDEELYDIMYDLVAYILDIPDEDKEYMVMGSVVAAVLKFMNAVPEAVNESEAFFE